MLSQHLQRSFDAIPAKEVLMLSQHQPHHLSQTLSQLSQACGLTLCQPLSFRHYPSIHKRFLHFASVSHINNINLNSNVKKLSRLLQQCQEAIPASSRIAGCYPSITVTTCPRFWKNTQMLSQPSISRISWHYPSTDGPNFLMNVLMSPQHSDAVQIADWAAILANKLLEEHQGAGLEASALKLLIGGLA